MKKIIYTLSFLAVSSFVAQAQQGQTQVLTTTPQGSVGLLQQDPAKKTSSSSSSEVKKVESSEAPKATRMAINEKGVPASKETKSTSATEKDAKATKVQKTANPGQPATTESK